MYPSLTLTPQEVQLHLATYTRDLFTWALKHYSDALPLHCTSLKSFVQVHHTISNCLQGALDLIRDKADPKLCTEL